MANARSAADPRWRRFMKLETAVAICRRSGLKDWALVEYVNRFVNDAMRYSNDILTMIVRYQNSFVRHSSRCNQEGIRANEHTLLFQIGTNAWHGRTQRKRRRSQREAGSAQRFVCYLQERSF